MASETTKEVADLRKQLSMGDLKIPQSEDVQTIAGAFKLYLKLLPEPILPSTTFKPLCQLIKKKFKGTSSNIRGNISVYFDLKCGNNIQIFSKISNKI
jgi:hypothetical protein